jgi:hypothetical protein
MQVVYYQFFNVMMWSQRSFSKRCKLGDSSKIIWLTMICTDVLLTLVTAGYRWLPLVTAGYRWLP